MTYQQFLKVSDHLPGYYNFYFTSKVEIARKKIRLTMQKSRLSRIIYILIMYERLENFFDIVVLVP